MTTQIVARIANFCDNCDKKRRNECSTKKPDVITLRKSMVSSAFWKKHAQEKFFKTITIARILKTSCLMSLKNSRVRIFPNSSRKHDIIMKNDF